MIEREPRDKPIAFEREQVRTTPGEPSSRGAVSVPPAQQNQCLVDAEIATSEILEHPMARATDIGNT
jgi:hypothetical protein